MNITPIIKYNLAYNIYNKNNNHLINFKGEEPDDNDYSETSVADKSLRNELIAAGIIKQHKEEEWLIRSLNSSILFTPIDKLKQQKTS